MNSEPTTNNPKQIFKEQSAEHASTVRVVGDELRSHMNPLRQYGLQFTMLNSGTLQFML